jgi:hypothetical protein
MEVDWGRLLMALVFGLVLDLYVFDLAFVCIKCDEWERATFGS